MLVRLPAAVPAVLSLLLGAAQAQHEQAIAYPQRDLLSPFRNPTDAYAPPDSVHALERCYAAAQIESKVLTPRGLGTRRIGHFGVFRREFRESFHEEIVSWVLARSGAEVAA